MDNEGKEMTFMGRATNPSYSEEHQTLQCELVPLDFDDDTNLVPVKERVREITAGSYTWTNITLESAVQPVENAQSDFCCTFDQVKNHDCFPMRPLCG